MSGRADFGVIGGYGATGAVVVSELAGRGGEGVLIGGRDAKRAAELAARVPGTIAVPVNVLDANQLDAFCARCRVVVNCAGPIVEIGDRVAQAAFRWSCHYVDPGGFLRSVLNAEMAPMQDPALRARDLAFVVSAGWIPGLSEVLVRYADHLAASCLERPGMLRLYLADSSDWSFTGFRDMVWHARHRLIPGLRHFRGGRARLPGPRSLTRMVTLPALGRRRVFLYVNQEIERYARARGEGLAAYVGNVSLRSAAILGTIALVPGLADKRAARWIRAGFRRDYAAGLRSGLAVVQVDDDAGSVEQRRLTVMLIESRHYWLTGLVPAMVASMLADGHPVERGAHFLGDAVEPMAFVEALKKRGVSIDAGVASHE